ncbi:hypothetical protein cce_2086 [Crocosphaera subtropica ATCC 51142]|uniref:Uncharacterized protein n=1 Tax=Crocosphaera subtropica (strain ATCC 51142 / BH68) TaxID=43989 RepID=B1WNK7_CROS5|nr:hypothetical protein cce_2086 [Crocosphaera subtropica ATCC 51142]
MQLDSFFDIIELIIIFLPAKSSRKYYQKTKIN